MPDWLEPLHDAASMRATDAWAIEHEGVPSLELMEAAGRAVAEAAIGLARPGPARAVCGKGNNGGDGIVAARHLAASGLESEVLLTSPPAELSPDARANLERFEGAVSELDPEDPASRLEGSGVIVDAIFGTGFTGPARGPAAGVIEAVNNAAAPVVAADIASGVDASTGEVEGPAVQASTTVSFHAAKLGHWIAPGKRHAGKLVVAPIGIPSRRPPGSRGGADPRAHPGAGASPGRGVDQVQLRPGPDRRRLARADRLGLHGGRGRDPLRRRVCDRRGPGGARGDLRDQADRGDVCRLPERRRSARRRRRRADHRRRRARGGGSRRARARAHRRGSARWSPSSHTGSLRRS